MFTNTLSTTLRSTAVRAARAVPSAAELIVDVGTIAGLSSAVLWGWLALAAALS